MVLVVLMQSVQSSVYITNAMRSFAFFLYIYIYIECGFSD